MSKKKSNRPALTTRYRRLSFLIAFIGVSSLAVVTATAISGKRSLGLDSRQISGPQQASAGVVKRYVTVKVAGREVQVDPQTGQIKPLTPEEAKQLADGLKVMLNRSTEGLIPVQHADGSVSMDLQGRFQNVAVARTNTDGSVTQSCVDNPEAAASFFGIDPQLLGVEQQNAPVGQSTRVQSTRVARQ
jgi:hypothetical protein